MRHASDRDRLDLNLLILSASHDTEIQQLTMGGAGHCWSLAPDEQGCREACRPGVTVPRGGCDWHLCHSVVVGLG